MVARARATMWKVKRSAAGVIMNLEKAAGPGLRPVDLTPRACASGWTSPRMGRKPAHRTDIDRDYETLRIGMQELLRDLAIETPSAA
jgi:hypothetical protein